MELVCAWLGGVTWLQLRMQRVPWFGRRLVWSVSSMLALVTYGVFLFAIHDDLGVWPAVSTFVLAAWFAPLVLRHVVFRGDGVNRMLGAPPAGDAAAPPQSEGFPLLCLSTGRLTFEDRATRRFVGAPARLGLTQDGHLLIHAEADGSRRIWGFTYVNLRGTWHALLAPAAIESVELGSQYLGLKGFPAIRVRCAGQTRILRFDDEAARAKALALLTAKVGTSTSRPRTGW
jgi:hypothetical protein